ncbi:MAG: anti-CBASS protein Acb1 family protein [Myxococcota bacterium]
MADRLRMLADAVKRAGVRFDAWKNELAGLGTSRDKAMYTRPAPFTKLSDTDLRNLYRSDDMAARIVDAKPDEALKKGFELHIADDDQGGELADGLMAEMEELDVLGHVRRLWRRARLYGGALLIVGADDGSPLFAPLAEERIRAVRWLQVVDRRYVRTVQVDEDPESPGFGEPTLYEVTVQMSGGGAAMGAATHMFRVHASRTIRMTGVEVDEEADADGWGDSVLQRAYTPLRQFQNAWNAVSHLMTDISQATLTIEGLWEMISSNPELLEQRMQMVDRHRSVSRMVLLNKSEEGGDERFERMATPLQGVADMLLHHGYRLSAAARTPITILLGISPPGSLNTAGEHEGEWWRDTIEALRMNDAKPVLRQLVRLFLLASEGASRGSEPESWSIRFPPLRQLTPEAEAERRFKVAQADHIYIQDGVVLAEEVALSRFTQDGYSIDTEIDRDAREKLLKLEKERQQEMAENPPEPPPGPGQEGPEGDPEDGPPEDDDDNDDEE